MLGKLKPKAFSTSLRVQTAFTNRAFRKSDCESVLQDLNSNHEAPLTLQNVYLALLQFKASKNLTHKGNTSGILLKTCQLGTDRIVFSCTGWINLKI